MCITLRDPFRPLARFAFAATVVLIPFRYRIVLLARPAGTVYGDFTDFLLFAGDVAQIATLLLWALSLAWRRRSIHFGPWFLTAPLAGLTLVGLLSTVTSVDPALTLYHSARFVLLDLLYLYVVNEITTWVQLAVPLAIQLLIQATVAVAQVLQQHSLGLTAIGEYTLDPASSGVSIVSADGIRSLRAYGLTDHPNLLGGFLAFALIALGAWCLGSESPWRTIVAIVVDLGALALLLTFSQTAWFALAAGVLCVGGLLWYTRRRQVLLDGLALMGASMIVLLPFLWHNAPYLSLDNGGGSAYEWGVLSAAANQMFSDHALTGVGLGAFPVALSRAYPQLTVSFQPAHLVLLDVAVETGMVGALCYSLLMLAPWLALWLGRDRLRWSLPLIGATGLLLALTLVGFFEYYTWLLAPGRLWQWLAWALWGTQYQTALRSTDNA